LSLTLLSKTFSLPVRTVTSLVSKMIWNEELSASLDQAAGVIVFHRIELTRTQQLAQTLADRVNTMVETNEKNLDLKFGGGSGWNDRADGKAGDKKEQNAERKGRPRGARGQYMNIRSLQSLTNASRRCSWWTWSTLRSRIGQPDVGCTENTMRFSFLYYHRRESVYVFSRQTQSECNSIPIPISCVALAKPNMQINDAAQCSSEYNTSDIAVFNIYLDLSIVFEHSNKAHIDGGTHKRVHMTAHRIDT
jgi:hypothetical protein